LIFRYLFRSRYALLIIVVMPLAIVGRAQVAVTTYHNDNARTGQMLSETTLTPSSVNSTAFGKLFSMPVDGYIYGQPLYVPNVNIAGKGVHNAVFVVTEHDSVFAFDADSNTGANSQPLWQVSFINPAKGITTVSLSSLLNCNDIVPEVGITSTPVIDPTSNTLYTVAKTSENGTIVQRLHALDITSGAEKFGGPVVIQAQVPGTGAGSSQGILLFNSLMENQRSGLLLQNGLVYVAWGSHCDMPPHHGWIMAYDAATLAQVAAWTASPNGAGAGVWQAGASPAADASYVYFSTGNGTFTLNAGGSDAGDTAVKLAAPVGGTFTIADYFTPENQSSLSKANRDLASGGEMLLPDQSPSAPHQHLLVAGGKQGTVYLIDRDNMGKFSPTANQNVQTLNSVTAPLYSTASWWNNNIYIGAGGKVLQAFAFNPSTGLLATTPASVSAHVFEGASGTVSISANGTTNSIVWALDNAGYSGTKGSNPALLFAYDATNLASLLFASNQNSARDKLGPAVKFSVPTISNGRVYIATQTEVDVLGLLPKMQLVAGGGQTGSAGSTLPIPIQVLTTDPYSGLPLQGATVTFSDGGRHGTFGTPVAVTNQSGNASTTYTLSRTPQTVTITATSPGFSTVVANEIGQAGPAAGIVVGGGNSQSGPPSTPLPASLAAKVRDQYANGVSGVLVIFSDGGAGGSFLPSQVTSDPDGYARTIYTTPPNPGTVKIKASAAGVTNPATFTATVE
jgi:hypothetical protein